MGSKPLLTGRGEALGKLVKEHVYIENRGSEVGPLTMEKRQNLSTESLNVFIMYYY